MENNSSTGLRLSLDELLFLCAGTGVGQLFGIKDGERDTSPEALTNQWLSVRESLTEKPYASVDGDSLRITASLADVIDVISHPNLFLVMTNRIGGKEIARNYYFSNRRVVRLAAEKVNQQGFFLTPLSTQDELEVDIQSFMELSDKEYAAEEWSFNLPAQRFNEYMEAVAADDRQLQQDILAAEQMPPDFAKDLSCALREKKHISTVAGLKIDGSESSGIEFLIYTAREHLWQIDLKQDMAILSVCGSKSYRNRLNNIAYLFNCF